MNLYLIKTQGQEIVGEVIKKGFFSVTVKNPVRLLDVTGKENVAIAYTVYSSLTSDEPVKINKATIISMHKLKKQHEAFYINIVTLLNGVVIPELDIEIGRFTLEILQAMQRYTERKEYLNVDKESDVVVVDHKSPERGTLN